MRLLFTCQRCGLEKRTWASSRTFGARYLLNQKLVFFGVGLHLKKRLHLQLNYIICRVVHGFTCAGILPTQYLKFATFTGMGQVGHRYMERGKL